MNIKETFLKLTTHTVPHKKEIEYLSDLLPMNVLKKDPVGNLYVKIGNSNTMFAAHLDTVGGDVPVNHVIDGKMIKTDGKSILGADDKSGVVILLYMIEHGVQGLYQFFLGEEVGCIGSKALVKWIEKNPNDNRYKNINKVISFDRKDVDSVITYQMSERCCSDEFADDLISKLKVNSLTFRKDTGGVLTDSVHFTDLYAECTNLSVGYWSQHTVNERQDIEFLEKLCDAAVKINWDKLTIKRKPGETERLYKNYSSSYNNYNNYDWDDDEYGYGYHGGGYNSNSRNSYNWQNSKSSASSGYVTDWRGDKVKSSETVWCEIDKVYCLKDEAIWVDLLGFYTTPDNDTKRLPSSSSNKSEPSDYKNAGEIINSSSNISIGDKIVHPSFGKGEIDQISPDKLKVVVKFSNGKKTLLLEMAKIKKLND
jgi:hypothetical protein